MQWIPPEDEKQSDALFDGQVTEVYLIDGHALPPSAIHEALAQPKPKQEPVVFFRTDNGWRKEKFEKTLVKKAPLDTTPPEPKPQVWFDFSNCDKYRSKEEFEKTLVPLDAAPPQPNSEQEPVAWRSWNDKDKFGFWDTKAEAESWCDLDFYSEPLYTTPPPQRTWVGLTDEERDHFEGLHLYAARNQVEAWIEGVPSFIDAIEAKLREKNGC